jgi:hypothetical protein
MKAKLSAAEMKILKKELRAAYITGILTGLMISIVYLLLTFIENSRFAANTFAIVLAIVTGSVFVTSLMLQNLYRDIFNRIKNINSYRIAEKLSYLDDESGIGGTVTKYYLITESKRFSVSEEQYDQAEIGDVIQEHESPMSLFLFHLEILKTTSDSTK